MGHSALLVASRTAGGQLCIVVFVCGSYGRGIHEGMVLGFCHRARCQGRPSPLLSSLPLPLPPPSPPLPLSPPSPPPSLPASPVPCDANACSAMGEGICFIVCLCSSVAGLATSVALEQGVGICVVPWQGGLLHCVGVIVCHKSCSASRSRARH